MSMSKRVSPENLTKFCIETFVKAGITPDRSRIIADVLVMTDTWGTFSHGSGL